MLLLHQVGSLKTGEVVRYTITYIPSQDRILPSPEKLYLRVRNTSAIALRAAFVHGPYTLCAAAYPAGYNPNEKFEYPERYGVPEFEPMVKAGGSWECELVVPVTIRQSAGLGSHGGFGKGPSHDHESASWIVEVSSQILFSTSAAVGFEVLLARDKKSLSLGNSTAVVNGQAQVAQPGKISDHQQGVGAKDGHHPAQPKGVFSRAIQVKVEDTATLWNTPRLPGWDDQGDPEKREGPDQHVESVSKTGDPEAKDDSSEPQKPKQKQKKVHMVVLTHGLHSNLGADMLFMKESIDATVKQAKIDAKARRARERAERKESDNGLAQSDSYNTKDQDRVEGEDDESDDDEEVIVRGYSGNSTKTERGIKYLGKRLARYVLSMTYPDQPFLPTGKGMAETLTHTFDKHDPQQKAVHAHSSIHLGKDGAHLRQAERPYKITSISFIAHSLGGLVQTYAIAYIQKHSPQFFDLIKPINFVALATPFLGLSNENPLYVKFALDSGLVGRTGKDLGLTWRAPTIARSGWGAIVGNLGETAHKKVYGDSQPESKPLLRILPTGPAHTALKKFRNRTVYSNVVNDGIVPLRTSCLLFLDWQGLGRVEKARRDAGLVETVVGFGWSELTGTAQGNARQRQIMSGERSAGQSGTSSPRDTHENMREVPQPPNSVMVDDDRASLRSVTTPYGDEAPSDSADSGNADSSASGPLSGFFNFFKSNEPPKPQNVSPKQKRIFSNSQTLKGQVDGQGNESTESDSSKPSKVTTGHEHEDEVSAPPRTTVFESASDLLNPKVPDVEYLIDPSKRPRTIFHDRIYHPSDIPGPPLKKRPSTLVRRNTGQRQNSIGQASTSSTGSSPYPSVNREDSSLSSKDYDDTAHTNPDKDAHEVIDTSNMRVEEKIARAYHKDLSWRKVLVKVEPDAHNNVFVRRMFANAYGWPVMKHLVDAHFSDSVTARLRMEDEDNKERARNMNEPPDAHGAELKKSRDNLANMTRTDSESREALDKVSDLPKAARSKRNSDSSTHQRPKVERADSVNWSDRDWHDSDNDSDLDFGGEPPAPTTPSALSPQDKGKEAQGSSGAGGWNWAEKIVGKGASRAKSPCMRAGEAKELKMNRSEL